MDKEEELRKCRIVDKKVTPMNCASCECHGCNAAEAAKEGNVGVCS